jgi:hypothetical protein
LALIVSTTAGCPDDTVDTGDTGDTAGETINPDRPDPLPTCDSTPRTPGTCAIGAVENLASRGAQHINVPTPLSYEDDPPSSGNHRPFWAKWGEYDYLAPQIWLHNLEHGGVAFLYDPCAPSELVDALRVFAQSQPDDDGGPFRWVLTPYPDLPTPVAAVAWTWTWQAECVDVESLEDFVVDHYRQAPEDVDLDGSYGAGWLGR